MSEETWLQSSYDRVLHTVHRMIYVKTEHFMMMKDERSALDRNILVETSRESRKSLSAV